MSRTPGDDAILEKLERDTFGYFVKYVDPTTGLVADNSGKESPSSIAAVGLALASYPAGAERGFITRADAAARTLAALGFFAASPQGTEPDATGYKGFYYHFLDMKTGRRVWECELSTIDTAFLLAGALAAAAYFDRDSPGEREVRRLADALYRRADWQWASSGGPTVVHGWRPESGFLPYRWEGYNEALLLYALALGSPTYPLRPESYTAWTRTYEWKEIYGYELLYAGPLFIHQISHIWIDFRGIQDDFMRRRGIDYFENSRRATYVQRAYAIENPKRYKGYGEDCWGITASDGPGPTTLTIDGQERSFYGYEARGVPYGPDDGTIAPWAVVASLPFAPEIVVPAMEHINRTYPHIKSQYGFECSFNPTFEEASRKEPGWISDGYYGLDQGPVILMIENHRSELLWGLMRRCAYLTSGLRRAGFRGGWLDA